MSKEIGQKIAELRRRDGLSQRALGKALGISNRAVSKWELGQSAPNIENLEGLAKVFRVSPTYFLKTEKGTVHEDADIGGMEALSELYRIGRGPSSSHTIGPERACLYFKERNSEADAFEAILYGSLAKTGIGHGTDTVIVRTFDPAPCKIVSDLSNVDDLHPNTIDLVAYREGKETDRVRVFSVGGGKIEIKGAPHTAPARVYPHRSFEEIATYCREHHLRLWEYAERFEGEGLHEYMATVWQAMRNAIRAGLDAEGVLPGELKVQRKAKYLFNQQHIDETNETRENRMVCAYAFAVSEQNAAEETIVTAPTCGASGVLPAVMYYQQSKRGYSDTEVIRALETAGVIGNLIKTNASISGAECGCQAEIGSACAMAAAALGELFHLSIEKIEYAAEIAIEHHLGLTCDPICGYVQIPCIERNAVAAMRAINAVSLSSFLSDTRKISLDKVIHAMKETGRDMASQYKETAEGGLAKIKI